MAQMRKGEREREREKENERESRSEWHLEDSYLGETG